MNQTNGTGTNMTPLDPVQMLRVMREMELLQSPPEWTLISPDGKVWRGDVQHIFSALAPHHPLLKSGGRA